MNRFQRRYHAARIGVPGTPPKRTAPTIIDIILIKPSDRSAVRTKMPLNTVSPLAICGKTEANCTDLGQEIVGFDGGLRVLLIGDRTPRPVVLGEPETTWMLRGDNGGPRDICRGVGIVVGYQPDTRKACSVTVEADWVLERIEWNPSEESE